MAEENNPFDIVQKPVEHEPHASPEKISELREAIKNISPEHAVSVVQQIEQATKEKKSASDIINTVVSLIGTAAKIAI